MVGGPYALEQLFVRPSGAGLELLLVKESVAGARFRETLTHPDRDTAAAVRRAARHLAFRGDIDDLSRLRVRLERGSELRDAPELRRAFVAAFDAVLAES